LAFKLRQFYQDWKAGKRPVLLIATPPQHGKSRSPCWTLPLGLLAEILIPELSTHRSVIA
jgi:hypothetical protein